MGASGVFAADDPAGSAAWTPTEPFVAGAVLSLLFWGYGVLDADDSAARVNARNGYLGLARADVQPLLDLASDGVRVGLRIGF
jgi:hypothetical protein